jgi:hypothetical protein
MTPFETGQPTWWAQAVGDSLGYQNVAAPMWPDLAELPAITLGDRRLNGEQIGQLLVALRKSAVRAPLPLIEKVREQCDSGSLDAFACRLFELCAARNDMAEVKWGLAAIGLLGGDASALKVTPFIREWPGQGFSQRATVALESLRAIGSETALMQLNGIAQKVRFPALQRNARRFMGEIAAERGLSAQQLEDRIVLDLGLDERGSRTFDYGSRQFRLVFGPNLKPRIRDDQGKTKSGLPKAGARDDPAKVEAAGRDWKLLKKQVSETVKVQAKRLERAMLTRRRWARTEFEKYIVGHPFLFHVARLLLWADYSENGALSAFRVTEDRTFAGVDDTAYTLRGTRVGIVHPLQLSEEDRAKWGEVFADYEIIPPFPQLGRRVHLLLPGEEAQTELTRFGAPAIPSIVFEGILKQQGWQPGRWGAASAGYYKSFPEVGITAMIQINWYSDQLRMPRVLFVPRGLETPGPPNEGQALRLGEVDAPTMSEVLGILTVLASKGT